MDVLNTPEAAPLATAAQADGLFESFEPAALGQEGEDVGDEPQSGVTQ